MKTKSWMERILHNWPVKVLSIAGAVLLFFFTNLLNLENRVVTLPIRYVLPQGFTESNEYPTKVRVRLRGNADKIYGITEDDLTVSADFRSHDREGQYKAPLMVHRSGVAAATEPLDITLEPAMVNLDLERAATREVPVNVRFSGSPRPGYQVVSYELSLARVMVSGPASRVQALQVIDTEIVDLSVRSQDFVQKVRLISADPLVKTAGSDSLDLKVTVGESVNQRTFSGVALAVIGLAPEFGVDQNLPAGTVTIQADSGELARLSSAQIRLLVDASQIRGAGIHPLKTICDAPPRTLVLSIDPPVINLVVSQMPADRQR